MTTLREVMDPVLRRLPEELADAGARERLLQVADLLPSSMTRGPLGLEIRLAGPHVVDLFAAAVPPDSTYIALVEALESGQWADTGRAADLAAVLRRWARREGALPAVARYLLVEADAPAAGEHVPVPSIFLAPRNPHDVWKAGMAPNAFQARPDVTTIAAAELSGVWPDPATAEALARLSDALPPTADIFAVGAMISRDAGASMRVAMRRLTPDQTFAVLTAMGRPVQAEVLAAWAQHTSAVRQAVALEIGPGAEHRVGLELAPDHDWKRSCLDGWPQLLDELVSQGLAVPARAARVAALVDSSGRPRWGLAHVKIAAGNDGLLPGSKLYVGLLHEDAQ